MSWLLSPAWPFLALCLCSFLHRGPVSSACLGLEARGSERQGGDPVSPRDGEEGGAGPHPSAEHFLGVPGRLPSTKRAFHVLGKGWARLWASLPVGPGRAPLISVHSLHPVHMQYGVSVCVILFVFISVIPLLFAQLLSDCCLKVSQDNCRTPA